MKAVVEALGLWGRFSVLKVPEPFLGLGGLRAQWGQPLLLTACRLKTVIGRRLSIVGMVWLLGWCFYN